MGSFFGASFLWVIFIALILYLYCTRSDNNHVTQYRRFAIFGLKCTVIAVLVMGFILVLLLLGVRIPLDDDYHEYGPGAAYGSIGGRAAAAALILMVGNQLYPDWMDYWRFTR